MSEGQSYSLVVTSLARLTVTLHFRTLRSTTFAFLSLFSFLLYHLKAVNSPDMLSNRLFSLPVVQQSHKGKCMVNVSFHVADDCQFSVHHNHSATYLKNCSIASKRDTLKLATKRQLLTEYSTVKLIAWKQVTDN